MNDKVSIIVPCYNQAQFLDEALQSVLDQTYADWECIIVNDGSPDNTEAVAQEWLEKDTRFKYLYQENGGLSSARNAGITIAEGEFILPLDADDRISTDYVVLAIAEFKKDSYLKVVYCKAEKFGDEIGIWELPAFTLELLAQENMIFCSGIYRKRDWEALEGYDTTLIHGLEDWDFWIGLLKNKGNIKKLDYIGFYYRINSNSMVRTTSDEELQLSKNIIWHKHIDFIISVNTALYSTLIKERKQMENNLKSEKFILNLFTEKFLGFKLFKQIDG